MAQFLLDEGEITEEEARQHPSQNQLDQCIGCGSCKPEVGHIEMEAGNLLILTTDGLHAEIASETFSSILLSRTNIEIKAKSLIKAGLDAGGTDNMTIVVAML
jgi:protein phosphatase